MAPPPFSAMIGTTCRRPRKGPLAFTDINASHASRSNGSAKALPLMPALLTRMSIGP